MKHNFSRVVRLLTIISVATVLAGAAAPVLAVTDSAVPAVTSDTSDESVAQSTTSESEVQASTSQTEMTSDSSGSTMTEPSSEAIVTEESTSGEPAASTSSSEAAEVSSPISDEQQSEPWDPNAPDPFAISLFAAKNFTKEQAMKWVRSQVGKAVDVDGYYGPQCVDLAMAYYDYLEGRHAFGNGVDYWYNQLPSGWKRIAYKKGFIPQAGDIMVWSGGYGHVAIFESGTKTHYTAYHQNFAGKRYVDIERNLPYDNYSPNTFMGVIRPNWSNKTTVSVSKVTVSPTSKTIEVGANFTLKTTVTPTNATNKAVSYKSSNTGVATVDSKGKVIGKKAGKAKITVTTADGKKTAVSTVTVKQKQGVVYQTHIQSNGWQNNVYNGVTSGTSGKGLRLEGIKVALSSQPYSGNIEYRTHIQGIGWEKSYRKNGALSGTSGKALRLEAIQIRLTGNMSKKYDVYYRVHAQNFGWLGWAKNNGAAGTAGYAYRLEAIQIKLVPKGGKAPGSTANTFHQKQSIAYQTHVQTDGWQKTVQNGATSGTSGRALRLEGIKVSLKDQKIAGNVEYRTHIQTVGWEKSYHKNGAMSGTSGKALRLEAIQLRLSGAIAKKYDIYYRVHAQHFGWMGWARNGEAAGTAGYAYRLEGIQIQVVPKGTKAPGTTGNAFLKK